VGEDGRDDALSGATKCVFNAGRLLLFDPSITSTDWRLQPLTTLIRPPSHRKQGMKRMDISVMQSIVQRRTTAVRITCKCLPVRSTSNSVRWQVGF